MAKLKNYVSETDLFLTSFDQTHKKTRSQQAEIAKHQAIHAKRGKDKPLGWSSMGWMLLANKIIAIGSRWKAKLISKIFKL
jgi:hypothetical protein